MTYQGVTHQPKMLQFLPLSIILVAVLGTQAPNSRSLVSSLASATELTQASRFITNSQTSNIVADPANAKSAVLVASSSNVPSNVPEGADKVGGIGMWLAIAAAGGSAAAVILGTRKANNPFKSSLKGQKTAIWLDQASPKLQKQLLRLLHNDRDTASRLLAQIKLHNPNQSVNWAAEKVIYDLERDRH